MTAESMLWLLMTGKVPTPEQSKQLSAELADRGELPTFVEKLLDSCVMLPSCVQVLTFKQSAEDPSPHVTTEYGCCSSEP